MISLFNHNFLRRTALAAAAAAGFFIATLPAMAQVKTDANTTLCNSYTSISIKPDASITIAGCSSTTPINPTPGAESFAITTAPASLANGAPGLILVTRTNPTAVDVGITYSITGGCSPTSGKFWIGQVRPTEGFQVVAPATGTGTCTISLTSAEVGSVGSPPSSVQIAYPTPTGGGTTTIAGCTATPSDAVALPSGPGGIEYSGADIINLKSGQVAYQALPSLAAYGLRSGKIQFNDVSYSAVGGAIQEVSIGPCPGVIDTSGGPLGSCYKSNNTQSNTGFMSSFWIQTPLWDASTNATAQTYGICWGYDTSKTQYINIRYTYSGTCPIIGGLCGYVLTWGGGPF
jgi:hypothetical protein